MAFWNKKGELKTIPRDENIEYWKNIYRNCPEWDKYEYATLEGIKRTRKRKLFKGAKLVCSEFVSLMFSERPTEELSDDLKAILKRSGWYKNITTFAEKSLALGGGSLKLYTDKSQDIVIDFVDADKFIPISWNNEIITEADFLSFFVYDGKKYLRTESHRKTDTGYNIKQRYYLCGDAYSITSVAPSKCGCQMTEDYEEGVNIVTDKPLFSYFKLPEANNIDFESSKSIAIYANAVDTLEGLDIAFDALQSEIVLGRKRIIVPAQAVRTITDDQGRRVKYFDPSDEIFTAFEGDDKDQLKIMDNSIELRVDEIRQAIQTYLDILSIQAGFSAGYLTFDGQSGVKTATEVISDNSKTHKSKVLLQGNLSDAINQIFESIQALSSQFKITVTDTTYQFQDNIIEDRTSKTNYWTGRLNSKTATLVEVIMNIDGLDQEKAEEKAEKILAQNATVNVDSYGV